MIILSSAITAMYYLVTFGLGLLYVFVLVWCADSGAYLLGRNKVDARCHRTSPPNKSVEGLLGGLTTGAGGDWRLFWLVKRLVDDGYWRVLLLSLLTIIMSVFGGLFENMLKRHAGVKDAGALLPGHGGILDRIDSQRVSRAIFALGFWAMKFYGLI